MQTLFKKVGRGPAFILAAAVLWSLGGIFIKFIDWHPMAIACVRCFFAALTFLLLTGGKVLGGIRLNRYNVIATLALSYTLIGFVAANKMTTAANAIVLQYMSPICIVVLSAVFFHQRPKKIDLIALGGALLGMVLFFVDSLGRGGLSGDLLALTTAVSYALVCMINHRPDCDSSQTLFLGMVLTCLVSLPFLFVPGAVTRNAGTWFVAAVAGILQIGLAYFCFSIGIKTTDPLEANLIGMLEPLLNPVWVMLFYGEVPGPMALVGAAVVVGCVTWLNAKKSKLAKQTPAEEILQGEEGI
ncbi:DMT family transporter [Feifania hominis]|uniref:DMT family transporter n=1 Tax=Feifania hominis TaxID=2763660 RepID=A0A926HPW7_9FIRM|nr:DMT family transporter [Feifania hominis]MBC8535712.1 DMT family transporter [Feifania hominis]